MMRLHSLLLSAMLLSSAFAGFASGQNNPATHSHKEYRNLPVDGNLAAILKDQLLEIKGMEDLRNLVEKIGSDPEFKSLMGKQGLARDGSAALDPATRKKLEDLLKKDGGKLHLDPEQLKAMLRTLEKMKETPGKKTLPAKEPGKTSEKAPPSNALVDRLAKGLIDRLEHTSAAEDSAAVQQSKERLSGHELLAKAMEKNGAERSGGTPLLPDLGFLKLPFDRGNWPQGVVPNLSSLGRLRDFDLAGGKSAGPGFAGTRLLWIGAIVAAVAILLRVLSRHSWRRPVKAVAGLGPWPIPPGQVASRQELIQAFDYLALLLLGEKARCANHRAIAGSLGSTPDKLQAAAELALFYEKARYDPVQGDLASSDYAAVRRDLCLLADTAETGVNSGEARS